MLSAILDDDDDVRDEKDVFQISRDSLDCLFTFIFVTPS